DADARRSSRWIGAHGAGLGTLGRAAAAGLTRLAAHAGTRDAGARNPRCRRRARRRLGHAAVARATTARAAAHTARAAGIARHAAQLARAAVADDAAAGADAARATRIAGAA